MVSDIHYKLKAINTENLSVRYYSAALFYNIKAQRSTMKG